MYILSSSSVSAFVWQVLYETFGNETEAKVRKENTTQHGPSAVNPREKERKHLCVWRRETEVQHERQHPVMPSVDLYVYVYIFVSIHPSI